MITRILSTAIALTALGAALGFASLEARGKRVTEVDIHVVDNDGAFLTADRIHDSLSAEQFIGELLTDLRLQDLVNDLEDMGPCEHAEGIETQLTEGARKARYLTIGRSSVTTLAPIREPVRRRS